MKKIITTVGTSVFTNIIKRLKEKNDDITGGYSRLEDARYSEWERLKNRDVKDLKEAIEEEWKKRKHNRDDSAEIKSICAIADELKQDVEVYLLATDTVLSRLACELVREWFKENYQGKYSIEFHHDDETPVIPGLQVHDKKLFEKKGLVNLIDKFEKIVDESYFENCILNITGGYKGLIPYLTIFGQISKVPIYYIFEDTNELIKIPQLHINVDWGFVQKNSAVFSVLSGTVLLENGKTWTDYKHEQSVPEEFDGYCQEETDDHNNHLVGLNAVGTFLWKEYRNYFFVKIPHTCKYFKEEVNGKRGVEAAIRELKRRLDELLKKSQKSFNELVDKDVKHVCIDDGTWVYKHSNPQVRLQYRYDQDKEVLTIYNYYFIKSKADDKEYSECLKKEYASLKESELTFVGFKKR